MMRYFMSFLNLCLVGGVCFAYIDDINKFSISINPGAEDSLFIICFVFVFILIVTIVADFFLYKRPLASITYLGFVFCSTCGVAMNLMIRCIFAAQRKCDVCYSNFLFTINRN